MAVKPLKSSLCTVLRNIYLSEMLKQTKNPANTAKPQVNGTHLKAQMNPQDQRHTTKGNKQKMRPAS